MSVLGDVFDSLKSMDLLHLLLAFIACMGYALAQGQLFGFSGRRNAAAVAFIAAAGFTLLAPDWMSATMLMAFAVAFLGLFVALAWLLSRWFGLSSNSPTQAEPDAVSESEFAPRADGTFASTRAPGGHAHSL